MYACVTNGMATVCDQRPDKAEWHSANDVEMGAIMRRETFSAPMTRKQRLAAGCNDIAPVPLLKLYEIKKNEKQGLSKFKVRRVLMGS